MYLSKCGVFQFVDGNTAILHGVAVFVAKTGHEQRRVVGVDRHPATGGDKLFQRVGVMGRI